jgi:hypothetical protein
MHNCRIFFGVTIALMLFLFAGFMPCLAAETDYIDNSAYTKPTQSKVNFNHDSHNENAGIDDCNGCHHLYEDGVLIESESSEDMPCAECHSPKMFNKAATLTTAFHKNFKGCNIQ